MTRRELLALPAGLGALSRLARAATAAPRLIVNSARPKDYEMPLAGFTDWITPPDLFFVRCHHYVPDVKLADWNLKLGGSLIKGPQTLAMSDLKKLPSASITSVLECAGNGRAFYEPHVPGMQWQYGGVANGKWTGVRLADVLNHAGIKDGAKHVLFNGADVPMGTMPDFERSLPIEKAMHPDTLLAYALNDAAIPADHGFPLRLIVPGWAGDSWVKWVTNIVPLEQEFDGFWMKTAYRHPTHPVEPGAAVPPSEMIPVTDLPLKSVIATPDNWVRPGRVRISGASWANGAAITAVDISTDGGKRWHPAILGPERSKYAWRLWHADWTAHPGAHTLWARAKTEDGRIEPLKPEWNPSGYLWNVAKRDVTVSHKRPPQPPGPRALNVAAAPAAFKSACLSCHGEDLIRMQKLTPAQWDKEVKKMEGWGAQVKPEIHDQLVKFLASQFKQ